MKDYFSFSKKERVAIAVLLVLMGVFLALPYFFMPEIAPPVLVKGTGVNEKDTLLAYKAGDAIMRQRLFYFNPNAIGAQEWKVLGLRDQTVKTIMNYRDKGGRFRNAEDIRKIWGLKPAEADRLMPYVRIPVEQKELHGKAKESIINLPRKVFHPIDVNKATAEEWKTLPGIGEVLARRVVKFREKLGRFSSIEQVGKTYGLSDSVFLQLKPYLLLDSLP